jgi:hypothetical protein
MRQEELSPAPSRISAEEKLPRNHEGRYLDFFLLKFEKALECDPLPGAKEIARDQETVGAFFLFRTHHIKRTISLLEV